MNTTIEQPELIASVWNDEGVCSNPEILKVGGLAKKHAVEIRLGVAPDGSWRVGYTYDTGKVKDSALVQEMGEPHASREQAIRAALLDVTHHFSSNKTSSAALDAFYEEVMKAPAPAVAVGEAEVVPLAAPLPEAETRTVSVSAITPNPENHRKHFDGLAMKELADSIVQTGLLQPIAVRVLSPEELGEMTLGDGAGVEGERLEIILGERRWRAHVNLGRALIRANVYRGVTRRQAKAAALIENLQRENPNAIEEAEGYRDLMEVENLTQDQCAKRLGRPRSTIANALRVLDLPVEVIDLIRQKKLTIAHGLALHKWRSRVAVLKVIAEESVQEATSAGQLEAWNKEDYVPFSNKLQAAGLIVDIQGYNLPGGFTGEWPAPMLNDPDFEPKSQYLMRCWAPAKWETIKAQLKADIAAAAEAERQKREEALKKSGGKIKQISDLQRGQYRELDADEQAEFGSLLPDSKVLEVKDDTCAAEKGKKATICLAPKFAARVESAIQAERAADRKTQWPLILAEARTKVRKWKKLGERETATLITTAILADEEHNIVICPASVKAQGMKFPAALALERGYNSYYGANKTPEDLGKYMKTLAADHVAYARAFVDAYILAIFTDGEWAGVDEPTVEELCFDQAVRDRDRTLLSWILERPSLGLLEETAAGRGKLAAQVKALPWYAAAFEQASKAGEDMGEISDVTTDPKILAEWVKAQAKGMPITEIARSYGVKESDVSGALAGRADAAEDGDE